jgi:hypothetical protein
MAFSSKLLPSSRFARSVRDGASTGCGENRGGTAPNAFEERPGGLRRRIHVEGANNRRMGQFSRIGTACDAANRGGARGIDSRSRSRTDRAVPTGLSSYTDYTSEFSLDTRRCVEGNGNPRSADAIPVRPVLGRRVPVGGYSGSGDSLPSKNTAVKTRRSTPRAQARHVSRATGLADWLLPGRAIQGV